jgi:hypothetical protein
MCNHDCVSRCAYCAKYGSEQHSVELTRAGLESRCEANGNNGQRRSGGQGRTEPQNIETRYRTRVIERQIAGMFGEMQRAEG